MSEYGHDFRPSYLKLGIIRDYPGLASIPILALTATAVPRVRDDIFSSLKMKKPYLSIKSFDRTNLIISAKVKPQGGFTKTLITGLVKDLVDAKNCGLFDANGGQSTIVSSTICVLPPEVYHISSVLTLSST